MVKAAGELADIDVVHALFECREPKGPYNGIWTCNSLPNVPETDLAGIIIAKHAHVLARSSVFCPSFKLGSHDNVRNGRWFADFSNQSLALSSPRSPSSKLAASTSQATPAPAMPTRSDSTSDTQGHGKASPPPAAAAYNTVNHRPALSPSTVECNYCKVLLLILDDFVASC